MNNTQQANGWIGRYGRMRKAYLEVHQPELLRELARSGRLSRHLAEIDAAARRRLEALMPALARNAGATETLKARDQLAWVQLMNACKAQAEEIITSEIIYT